MATPAEQLEQAPEQLEMVQGFPVSSKGFDLTSAKGWWTDKELVKRQHVSGHFTGYVKGYHSKQDRDESDRHFWIVEMTDVELD